MKIVLEQLGIDQERVALEWVSAAEAPLFVKKITSFTDRIRDLGHLGKKEGLDRERLLRKIAAARIALEGMKLRSAFARQAKQVKETNSYGKFPDPEKLRSSLAGEMTLQEVFLSLREEKGTAAELAVRLDIPEEQVCKAIETLQKKKKVNADGSII
jgi:F420-non-reducing hydrogenase iron-sulfur subunit